MKMIKKITLTSLLLGTLFFSGCGNNGQITYIHTNDAPEAIGPYQQAVVIDKMVYCSGQIAIDPTTNKLIDGDVGAQTHQIMKNIKAILSAASSDLDHIVKASIFMINLDNFSTVNEIYSTYFSEGHYPARSCVEVSELPKGAEIEIEVIAAQI